LSYSKLIQRLWKRLALKEVKHRRTALHENQEREKQEDVNDSWASFVRFAGNYGANGNDSVNNAKCCE
jgi:hypothetical protein